MKSNSKTGRASTGGKKLTRGTAFRVQTLIKVYYIVGVIILSVYLIYRSDSVLECHHREIKEHIE